MLGVLVSVGPQTVGAAVRLSPALAVCAVAAEEELQVLAGQSVAAKFIVLPFVAGLSDATNIALERIVDFGETLTLATNAVAATAVAVILLFHNCAREVASRKELVPLITGEPVAGSSTVCLRGGRLHGRHFSARTPRAVALRAVSGVFQ